MMDFQCAAGHQNERGDVFCGTCGLPLNPVPQRRDSREPVVAKAKVKMRPVLIGAMTLVLAGSGFAVWHAIAPSDERAPTVDEMVPAAAALSDSPSPTGDSAIVRPTSPKASNPEPAVSSATTSATAAPNAWDADASEDQSQAWANCGIGNVWIPSDVLGEWNSLGTWLKNTLEVDSIFCIDAVTVSDLSSRAASEQMTAGAQDLESPYYDGMWWFCSESTPIRQGPSVEFPEVIVISGHPEVAEDPIASRNAAHEAGDWFGTTGTVYEGWALTHQGGWVAVSDIEQHCYVMNGG